MSLGNTYGVSREALSLLIETACARSCVRLRKTRPEQIISP